MRSLKKLCHESFEIATDLALTAVTWNNLHSDCFFCAFGPSKDQNFIRIKSYDLRDTEASNIGNLVASWDTPRRSSEFELDRILNFHYVAQDDTLCLVFAGGDIVIVRQLPLPDEEKIEIVGSVDVGITAAKWSPDDEILTITTANRTVLFMTRDYEIIVDTPFSNDDARLSKQVSVGWGKTETQFKGKRARALRDPTVPRDVDEGRLHQDDNGRVTIAWRGDGAFVAINSVEQHSRRMIRIYTREGLLDGVSEPVDGLEDSMFWRPSGNLIACVQTVEKASNVIFFERNGLRHGGFPLDDRQDDQDVQRRPTSLVWNPDSSILAVVYSERIQLWTTSNYRYSLKQEIPSPPITPKLHIPQLKWHSEDSLRLIIAYIARADANDESPASPSPLVHVSLSFDINIGPLVPPYDFGATAIMHGRTLDLTALRVANIPPPMAQCTVLLPKCCIDVAFDRIMSYVAVLHLQGVSLISWDLSNSSEAYIERTFPSRLMKNLIPLQICMKDKFQVYVLMSELGTRILWLWDVLNSQYSCLNISAHSAQIILSLDGSDFYLAHDSQISLVSTRGQRPDEADTWPVKIEKSLLKLPRPPARVQVITETLIYSLTQTGAIFKNDVLLARDCTSFLVTKTHLIITTNKHLLKFLKVEESSVPLDDSKDLEQVRSIERGAKLINVMPSSYAVVLQMPRGNLETVYPRALVLTAIRDRINDGKYRDAFLICRAQRVDMNILYDHSPQQFLRDIKIVIEQLGKVEYIDLFLSQLKDGDVSQTLYTDATFSGQLQETHSGDLGGRTNKINKICDAVLEVLSDLYSTNIQNTITANMCKIPPNVEEGLLIVSKLKSDDPDLATTAVEHICFLADVNKIYDHALAMYDLDLALMIAQHSQKDPREYLPALQKYQRMTADEQKFAIENDLGNYEKALGHLKLTKDFDRVIEYIVKHSLYAQALGLYRYDKQSHNAILSSYADHLSHQSKHHEAALAYEATGDFASASNSYRLANLWRECLSTANFIPMSPAQLGDLARSLAENLTESKDHTSAARIYLHYLTDRENAIACFCRGHRFAEAMQVCARFGPRELLTSTIDPALAEAAGDLMEIASEMKGQLGAQVPRLKELRILKETDPLKFFEGATESGDADIPDDISIAASTTASTNATTLFTRYTSAENGTAVTGTSRKTSKNRRREERKRARGKKGSIYEEEYLVNSVGRLVERLNETSEDAQNTVSALCRRGMWERARALEHAFVDVIDRCREVLPAVFESNADSKPTVGGAFSDTKPPGAEGVLWDSEEAVRRPKQVPDLKLIHRNALLA